MLYDIVGVNLVTGRIRLMAVSRTLADAQAYVKLAVGRRGVDEEFFAEVPAASYCDGEVWDGDRNTSPEAR